METIVAAVVSAMATIIAAWISVHGGRRAPASTGEGPGPTAEPTHDDALLALIARHTTRWTAAMAGFAVLVVGVGFLVHHDLPPLFGLVGIPVLMIVLAVRWPVKPWTAAAFIFGVTTITLWTQFAVDLVRTGTVRLSPADASLPFTLLLLALAYAAIGAALCWWRLARLRG